MRILIPAVATCAAAVMTSTLGLVLPAAADTVTPDVEKKSLTDVSEPGLEAPGARAASGGAATAANQSMTNLPNLMKSETLLKQQSIGTSGAFSAAPMSTTPGDLGDAGDPDLGGGNGSDDSTQAPDEPTESPEATEEPDMSGSVQEKTEDGVNIAAISEVLEVPAGRSSVIGASYEGDTNVTIEVRVETSEGWSAWEEVEHENGQGEGIEGTEPFIVNAATAVQMRVLGSEAPTNAELVLVDPKTAPGDAAAVANNTPVIETEGYGDAAEGDSSTAGDESTEDGAEGGATQQNDYAVQNASYVPGSAEVSNTSLKKVPKPEIGSRKSWGADESKRKGSPSYADGVKAAVIHHTAGSNNYKASDVPGILRGIYSFHTSGRGWADVGYNVLADKYGRLWEGRAGGLDRAVIGAHVAGYNTGTFGISVMGTYDKSAPPEETLRAVEHAIAWKLSANGVPAKGKTNVAGRNINTIVGHRDLGNTTCPGAAFYAKIGGMRNNIEKMQQSGQGPKDDSTKEEPKKTPIDEYAARNADKLGKATGDEKEFQGGTVRDFEKGAVYHKNGKTVMVAGAIRKLYSGEMRDTLGFPITDEHGGLTNGGAYQKFEKGSVHWSKATGAQPTYGVLQKYWGSKGYEKGHLGYPTGKPSCDDNRCEQKFQGARLVWANGYGTTEFSPSGSIEGGVRDHNQTPPPGEDNSDEGTEENGDSPADDGEGPADDDSKKDEKPKKKDDKRKKKGDKPKKKDDKPKKKDDKRKKKDDKPKKKDDKPKKKEKELRDSIIKTAKKGLGVRYVWGGNTTSGWDCSGYTRWVYKQNGINLPRHSSAQKAAGKVIPASEAKPGDLIWVPGHIGIVSETKGQMYDAGSRRTGTSKRSYSWMLKRGAVFVRVVD